MRYTHLFGCFPLAKSIAVCQYVDMICPNCQHTKTEVTNSRTKKVSASVWRRRKCATCKLLFTTYETLEMHNLYKVKKDKSLVAFSKVRLLLSLLGVLEYTGHEPEDAYWLTETVMVTLSSTYSPLSPLQISNIAYIAYNTLVAYDELAGRAYAAKHNTASK